MKFRNLLVGLATAVGLSTGAALAAAEPLVLKPNSKWNLDYSDDSCALKRQFGEEGKQAYLELRQFSPESSLQVVIGSDWKMTKGTFDFAFEPQEWRKDYSGMYARFGEVDGVILTADILLPTPDREFVPSNGEIDRQKLALKQEAYKQTTAISIAGAFEKDFTLRTGSLGAPFEAMDKCLDELLNHWGIDADAHHALTRRAVPKDLKALAKRIQSKYPAQPLREGMPAILRVRLGIDETGKVTACRMQLQYAEPEFEKAACKRLEQAPFNPALDKDGKPIASYWTTSIIYEVTG